jgi:RNA polymerase sigma-70 factor (ECF subfamily)
MDDLGERLSRGDPEAFAALYDACADRLHHYLTVYVGSRQEADDLVQEVFLRLARNRHKLCRAENLVAYVFTVARNEASRLMRRRHGKRGDSLPLSADELFVQISPDNAKVRENAELVTSALARLPERLRELVELKTYAALTFAEIAEVTGLPQGTVATRYRTALEQLRKLLAKEFA